MASRSKPTASHGRIITVGRRRFPLIGEVRIRGRKYWLLERLTGRWEKFLACEAERGSLARLCTLMQLPNIDSTAQHIHVLSRLPCQADLPRIVDFEKRKQQTDLVLNWVEGVDLAEYLDRVARKKVARPSAFEAIRLIRGLAHALRTLNHHAQLVHGDLKPSNLVLTRKPARLLMIDFGSSWPIERAGFRCEGDGVTRVYSSPEQQVADGVVDHRSDQFSASVILYQLLTLRVPYLGYGGQAGRTEFRGRLEGSLKRPSQETAMGAASRRSLRSDLDDVVMTGLCLDACDRFATSSAWLSALDSVYDQLKAHERIVPSRKLPSWKHVLTRVRSVFRPDV